MHLGCLFSVCGYLQSSKQFFCALQQLQLLQGQTRQASAKATCLMLLEGLQSHMWLVTCAKLRVCCFPRASRILCSEQIAPLSLGLSGTAHVCFTACDECSKFCLHNGLLRLFGLQAPALHGPGFYNCSIPCLMLPIFDSVSRFQRRACWRYSQEWQPHQRQMKCG